MKFIIALKLKIHKKKRKKFRKKCFFFSLPYFRFKNKDKSEFSFYLMTRQKWGVKNYEFKIRIQRENFLKLMSFDSKNDFLRWRASLSGKKWESFFLINHQKQRYKFTYFIFIELLVSIIFCICYASLLGMWYGFLNLRNNLKYNI